MVVTCEILEYDYLKKVTNEHYDLSYCFFVYTVHVRIIFFKSTIIIMYAVIVDYKRHKNR